MLIELTDKLNSVCFDAGTPLIKKNDVADRMFIIVDGKIDVYLFNWEELLEKPNRPKVATLGKKSVLGD